MYILTGSGMLLKRSAFQSWPKISPPAGALSFTAIAANDTTLFAATDDTTKPLYKTTDGGATWSTIAVPKMAILPLTELTSLPNNQLKLVDNKNTTFVISTV